MIDISQNRIEVGYDILVALFIHLLHSFLENFQRLVCLILLIMGQSQVIIELHRIGIILQSRSRHLDHFIQIIVTDGVSQQLQTGRFVLRIQG